MTGTSKDTAALIERLKRYRTDLPPPGVPTTTSTTDLGPLIRQMVGDMQKAVQALEALQSLSEITNERANTTKADLDKERKAHMMTCQGLSDAEARAEALAAENERFKKTLAFYADRKTWRGDDPPIKRDCDGDFVACCGKRARATLDSSQ